MDKTIQDVLLEIQAELKEAGKEYSIEELYDVCSSQFKIANLGFKKKMDIRLPIFGSFIDNDKAGAMKTFAEFEETHKDSPPSLYKKLKAELKVQLADKRKRIQKERNSKKNRTTLEDIYNTKDIVNIPNKFDKYVKNEKH